MKERGFGRIINIGSEVFELGNPCFANYVAAKGAQLGAYPFLAASSHPPASLSTSWRPDGFLI